MGLKPTTGRIYEGRQRYIGRVYGGRRGNLDHPTGRIYGGRVKGFMQPTGRILEEGGGIVTNQLAGSTEVG